MKTLKTDKAPPAIGPYSQGKISGGVMYLSGQIALDVSGKNLVGEDAAAQTRQVMENITALLSAEGRDFSNVLKTTIYLTKMDDFAKMNEVYAAYFSGHPPARSTVAVSELPRGAVVEIECIVDMN